MARYDGCWQAMSLGTSRVKVGIKRLDFRLSKCGVLSTSCLLTLLRRCELQIVLPAWPSHTSEFTIPFEWRLPQNKSQGDHLFNLLGFYFLTWWIAPLLFISSLHFVSTQNQLLRNGSLRKVYILNFSHVQLESRKNRAAPHLQNLPDLKAGWILPIGNRPIYVLCRDKTISADWPQPISIVQSCHAVTNDTLGCPISEEYRIKECFLYKRSFLNSNFGPTDAHGVGTVPIFPSETGPGLILHRSHYYRD